MLALSIRQPWAELILRGVKTMECRSRSTRHLQRRFYIYAPTQWAGPLSPARPIIPNPVDSPPRPVIRGDNFWVPSPSSPVLPWMFQLADAMRLFHADLPRGVIVGTAAISHVTRRDDGLFQWHLADVQRLKPPRKPRRQPQPVWFRPFD